MKQMSAQTENTRTILIVDDTPANIDLLSSTLGTEYNVITATSGSEALEIARLMPPDLILLDIMMSKMNGYEVCKALKADTNTQRIPVIFVSGLLDPGDETSGFEAGGVDYITKPFLIAVVRARVKAHLALKDVQDQQELWIGNLKKRLLQSIKGIRARTEALVSAEEKAMSLHGYVGLFSGVFELMEDRFGVRSHAISELAGDAARKMKLPAEMVAKVRLAGLLHDIGTLGPLRGSSEKTVAEMTTNELEEYHTHPLIGQELFNSFEELQDVALMVRSHHEAFGGGGFPDGIMGDDIPLGARLVAIADIIEHAATSVTGERAEFAIMKARLHSVALLDPKLVPYFSSITHILYFEGKKIPTKGEVEVPIEELLSGMELSRNLSTKAGMLLLQKEDILDIGIIEIIRINSRKNFLPDGGVWIQVIGYL
jgi:putative two-component system response regulator